MAGLGFKDFQVGEVLTSANVDGYLMQQTVMRFADSAARGSALGTATGTAVPLAEGMLAYLDDSDAVQVYDGTAWQDVNLFRQVVQTVKTDTFTSTSATFTPVTGLSVSITPTASTSKVLIVAQVGLGGVNVGGVGHVKVTRGGTDIYRGDAASSRVRAVFGGYSGSDTQAMLWSNSIVYLDSPATTSSTTYQVEVRRSATGTVYINRSGQFSDDENQTAGASSITVMEVAG